MARFHIVPENDWNVLKKYLGGPNGEIVLLPESTMNQMPPNVQDCMRELDDTELYFYAFGGEPDIVIDVIHNHTKSSDILRGK